MKRTSLLFIILWIFSSSSFATEYLTIHPDQSSISFSYDQMGVSMAGHFNKFSGDISFDTEHPEKARASIDIDLSSIDTGSPENNNEVSGQNWLNTENFTTAHFETKELKQIDDSHYEVSGQLTIKGISRPIVAPASFTDKGDRGVFESTFTLKREEFSIGEGEWSSFDVVANDIKVNVKITALSSK